MSEAVEAIGRRLRILRYACGYDGRRLSEWCRWIGIGNPSQWHQYESGGKRIRIDEALQVMRMTGATLDWIYDGDAWTWTLPAKLTETLPEARRKVDEE